MTYIVNDNCINCKYTDCVEVCPVDCFYEGENMLVIHPDECIDCGVCEPECPPEAILPDSEPAPRNGSRSTRDGRIWPNIVQRRSDAERGNRQGRDRQVREAFLAQSRPGQLSDIPVDPAAGPFSAAACGR